MSDSSVDVSTIPDYDRIRFVIRWAPIPGTSSRVWSPILNAYFTDPTLPRRGHLLLGWPSDGSGSVNAEAREVLAGRGPDIVITGEVEADLDGGSFGLGHSVARLFYDLDLVPVDDEDEAGIVFGPMSMAYEAPMTGEVPL